MLTLLSDQLRRSASPDVRRLLKRWAGSLFPAIGSIEGAITSRGEVALTFDDGPDATVTPRILDLLNANGRHATFFVLTDKAAAHPDLMRRIVAEGHEVALHFDTHDRLTAMPPQVARKRLRAARARLERLAGPVRYFRPPFGSQNLITYLLARSEGLQVVSWGPYAEDWVEQAPATAAEKVLRDLSGGDIILLHDGLEKPPGESLPSFDRVRMVELILDGMLERGLTAVTVDTLVASGPRRLVPWFRR